MAAETSTNDQESRQPVESPALVGPNDTQDIVLASRDTIAELVPDEVQPREKKSYRDAGGGGWRVWK